MKRKSKQTFSKQFQKNYYIFAPNSYNNNIYIQCDRVAVGSPLVLLLEKIFMELLEEDLAPTLKS